MFLRRFAPTIVVVVAVLLSGWATGAQATGQHRSNLHGTITFFDYQSLQNPLGKKLLRAYEHSHPGVTVKISSMPAGDPLPIIDAQLAGGTAADVMALATDEQPWKDLSKGWYLDLTRYAKAPDPYVRGNKHWINLLTPSAANEIKFSNGHVYALTTTGFDVAFIYNKTIFSKLHLGIPRTWPQLLNEYKKIKAAGYIPLEWELGSHQYGGQTEQYITILEDTVMHSTIARLEPRDPSGMVTTKELVNGIEKGIYSAHNADYQESWKLLKMLSPYFQLGASSATSSSDGFNTFKTGRVATWFEGSFNSSSLDGTNIKWGAFVTPRLTTSITRFATNGPQRTGGFGACCGYPWTIPVTTQKHGHLKLALDFLYWLSAPKNTTAYANGSGVLSMERNAKTPKNLAAFSNAAAHVSRLAVAELSMPPEFIETRARLVEEYINGTITLGQAMNQMQAEMNKDAAIAKKMYGFK